MYGHPDLENSSTAVLVSTVVEGFPSSPPNHGMAYDLYESDHGCLSTDNLSQEQDKNSTMKSTEGTMNAIPAGVLLKLQDCNPQNQKALRALLYSVRLWGLLKPTALQQDLPLRNRLLNKDTGP